MANGADICKEWLEIAHMDIEAAQFLMQMRPLPVEVICYHCEQAAEKALKGYLVYKGEEAPKTHDLIRLCKLCCDIKPDFQNLSDQCLELIPYGVTIRYPSKMDLHDEDAASALSSCKEIINFVERKI